MERAAPSQDNAAGGSGGVTPDRGGRGMAILAWVVTLALVVFIAVAQNTAELEQVGPGEVAPPDALTTLLGRYAAGSKSIISAGGPDAVAPLIEQFDQQAGDEPAARLRATMLVGELAGENVALERIETLRTSIAERISQAEAAGGEDAEARVERLGTIDRDAQTLESIYMEGAGSLGSTQQGEFEERHGWFARLAISHGMESSDPVRAGVMGEATRTFITMISIVMLAIGAALVGLVLGIIAITQIVSGKLNRWYFPPPPGGSVYLEAFAIFMVGFIAIQAVSMFVLGASGIDLTAALIWLLPLAGFWPVVRGQDWARHKFAMGWHRGRGVVREIGAGFIGYLAGLPVFAMGIALTLLFGILGGLISGEGEGGAPGPTHPILDQIAAGDVATIIAVYVLAALWAPITEESLFRGALQHHLRGRMRFVPAGLLTAFIFAVVHPQGWIAVPALMSLGFVLSMLREWRGSIIAPAFAHGMHNATIVTVLVLGLT